MTTTTSSPRALLREDHERIHALVDEIADASEAGVDKRALIETWRRFESALLAHLGTEEALLFPLYEADYPAEIATLRLDHRQLRDALDALGMEVELGVIRDGTVQALLAMLRRHAAREDADLYRWAERDLDEVGTERLIGMLR